jgi:hypothetical protein
MADVRKPLLDTDRGSIQSQQFYYKALQKRPEALSERRFLWLQIFVVWFGNMLASAPLGVFPTVYDLLF